jgi:hypothetical protein
MAPVFVAFVDVLHTLCVCVLVVYAWSAPALNSALGETR